MTRPKPMLSEFDTHHGLESKEGLSWKLCSFVSNGKAIERSNWSAQKILLVYMLLSETQKTISITFTRENTYITISGFIVLAAESCSLMHNII